MTRAAVRQSVTLAGRAEQARVARVFVGGVLGRGTRARRWLCFWGAFGNSGSGGPGETVTVAVRAADGVVGVEVADRSGPGVPELRLAGDDVEGCRGLGLVAVLAARWGWRRCGGRTVTWFETLWDD